MDVVNLTEESASGNGDSVSQVESVPPSLEASSPPAATTVPAGPKRCRKTGKKVLKLKCTYRSTSSTLSPDTEVDIAIGESGPFDYYESPPPNTAVFFYLDNAGQPILHVPSGCRAQIEQQHQQDDSPKTYIISFGQQYNAKLRRERQRRARLTTISNVLDSRRLQQEQEEEEEEGEQEQQQQQQSSHHAPEAPLTATSSASTPMEIDNQRGASTSSPSPRIARVEFGSFRTSSDSSSNEQSRSSRNAPGRTFVLKKKDCIQFNKAKVIVVERAEYNWHCSHHACRNDKELTFRTRASLDNHEVLDHECDNACKTCAVTRELEEAPPVPIDQIDLFSMIKGRQPPKTPKQFERCEREAKTMIGLVYGTTWQIGLVAFFRGNKEALNALLQGEQIFIQPTTPAPEVLLSLKETCEITDRKWPLVQRILRLGRAGSLSNLKNLKREWAAELPRKAIPCGYYSPLEDVLESRLRQDVAEGRTSLVKTTSDGEMKCLSAKFSMDGAKLHNSSKLSQVVLALDSLNGKVGEKAARVFQPSNTTQFAVAICSESYDELKSCFTEVFADLNKVLDDSNKTIEIDGETYALDLSVCVDLKCLATIIGLYNTYHAKSKYRCCWCNTRSYVTCGDLRTKDSIAAAGARCRMWAPTVARRKAKEPQQAGQIMEPLLKCSLSKIRPCMLHCKMGLVRKLLKKMLPTSAKCANYDQIEIYLQETIGLSLLARTGKNGEALTFQQRLKSCRITGDKCKKLLLGFPLLLSLSGREVPEFPREMNELASHEDMRLLWINNSCAFDSLVALYRVLLDKQQNFLVNRIGGKYLTQLLRTAAPYLRGSQTEISHEASSRGDLKVGCSWYPSTARHYYFGASRAKLLKSKRN